MTVFKREKSRFYYVKNKTFQGGTKYEKENKK